MNALRPDTKFFVFLLYFLFFPIYPIYTILGVEVLQSFLYCEGKCLFFGAYKALWYCGDSRNNFTVKILGHLLVTGINSNLFFGLWKKSIGDSRKWFGIDNVGVIRNYPTINLFIEFYTSSCGYKVNYKHEILNYMPEVIRNRPCWGEPELSNYLSVYRISYLIV
jgi:hypothetical protein